MMVEHGASYLFLSAVSVAAAKIQGVMRRLAEKPLDAPRIQQMAYSMMRDSQL